MPLPLTTLANFGKSILSTQPPSSPRSTIDIPPSVYSILPYHVTSLFLFPHTFHILPWPTHPSHLTTSSCDHVYDCIMLHCYYIIIIHITSYYLCMYTLHLTVYSTTPSPSLPHYDILSLPHMTDCHDITTYDILSRL